MTAEKIEEVEYETLSREDDDATTVDKLSKLQVTAAQKEDTVL